MGGKVFLNSYDFRDDIASRIFKIHNSCVLHQSSVIPLSSPEKIVEAAVLTVTRGNGQT